MEENPDKTQITKVTVQVDEGVEVTVEFVPSPNGNTDQTEPKNHQVQSTAPPTGYKRGYRWNAAGCA
jgi:hypothetical protein